MEADWQDNEQSEEGLELGDGAGGGGHGGVGGGVAGGGAAGGGAGGVGGEEGAQAAPQEAAEVAHLCEAPDVLSARPAGAVQRKNRSLEPTAAQPAHERTAGVPLDRRTRWSTSATSYLS